MAISITITETTPLKEYMLSTTGKNRKFIADSRAKSIERLVLKYVLTVSVSDSTGIWKVLHGDEEPTQADLRAILATFASEKDKKEGVDSQEVRDKFGKNFSLDKGVNTVFGLFRAIRELLKKATTHRENIIRPKLIAADKEGRKQAREKVHPPVHSIERSPARLASTPVPELQAIRSVFAAAYEEEKQAIAEEEAAKKAEEEEASAKAAKVAENEAKAAALEEFDWDEMGEDDFLDLNL